MNMTTAILAFKNTLYKRDSAKRRVKICLTYHSMAIHTLGLFFVDFLFFLRFLRFLVSGSYRLDRTERKLISNVLLGYSPDCSTFVYDRFEHIVKRIDTSAQKID